MNNDAFTKTYMAKTLLENAHPLIRETLLQDPEFRIQYGFKANAVLTLEGSGVSIKRSKLFSAIKKALSGNSNVTVGDVNGKDWKIQIANETGIPIISLSIDDQRLTLPDFSALSPYSSTRLRVLEKSASDVNLPADNRKKWHKILSERSLVSAK